MHTSQHWTEYLNYLLQLLPEPIPDCCTTQPNTTELTDTEASTPYRLRQISASSFTGNYTGFHYNCRRDAHLYRMDNRAQRSQDYDPGLRRIVTLDL